jgi:hypothetical protein
LVNSCGPTTTKVFHVVLAPSTRKKTNRFEFAPRVLSVKSFFNADLAD